MNITELQETTNYYYTLNTIPQVLAALLGLSAVFLIQIYTKVKNEISFNATLLCDHLSPMNFDKNIENYISQLNKFINANHTKGIYLWFNEDEDFYKSFKQSFDNAIKKNEQTGFNDEKKKKFIKDLQLGFMIHRGFYKYITEINGLVKWAFIIGIPVTIISISVILFVPYIVTSFLLLITVLLLLGSGASITLLTLIVFKTIKFNKYP